MSGLGLVLLLLISILITIIQDLVFGTAEDWRLYAFVDYGMTALLTAVFAVFSAVGYHDLRLLKDGVDIDNIAAVFD